MFKVATVDPSRDGDRRSRSLGDVPGPTVAHLAVLLVNLSDLVAVPWIGATPSHTPAWSMEPQGNPGTAGREVSSPLGADHPSWAQLAAAARGFRVAHAAWSVAGLSSLGYIWACALTGRRDRPLAAAVAFLSVEGVALVVGRGDCPFGPLQARLGDPVPLFELVLPPRAAKAAVPVLTGLTVAGLAVVAVRGGRAMGGRRRPQSPPAGGRVAGVPARAWVRRLMGSA